MAQRKKATQNRAETAQQVKEKYENKRFKDSTEVKMTVLYNYVYAAYQVDESVPSNEIKPLFELSLRPITDNSLLTDVSISKPGGKTCIVGIMSGDDIRQYNAFVHLQEWTENAFKTAVFMRNALKSVISDFHNTAATIISAEELRKALNDKANDKDVALWLSTISIDFYAPQAHGSGIAALRNNIMLALRYLHAYNTFIELVAAAVKIPEFTIFKVNMTSSHDGITSLNEALSTLNTCVRENRPDDEYLDEILKAFEPIEMEPEPIPEQNIKNASDIITVLCSTGLKTWTSAFTALYKNYWRQA